MKMILKEIMITLLMCVAILLILGIVFYDYNPLSKIIPNRIAYTTPNEVKSEIDSPEEKDILDDSFNVVYSIDNADLQKYKKSKRYAPGREHPFAALDVNNGQTPVNAVTSGTAVNEIKGTTTNPDSTNKYLNTGGKK